MAHLDRPMYLLGYLASTSRVYLIDKEFGIVSYTLLMSLIEYKTLVMRGDEEAAAGILPTIPKVCSCPFLARTAPLPSCCCCGHQCHHAVGRRHARETADANPPAT
jgi:Coatomer WD associated region